MKQVKDFFKNIPNKTWLLIIGLLLILYIGSSIYLMYYIYLFKGVEDTLRLAFIILIAIITIIFIICGVNALIKNKKLIYTIFIIMILIIGSTQTIIAHYINKTYSSISKINKEEVTYSTSLITLAESNLDKIKDFKNKKIGIISDKKNIEGYIISQEIIKDNNLKKDNSIIEYDDFLSMLNDLYDKEIDALFIATNYQSMFSTELFDDLKNDTKIILTKTKTMIKEDETTTNNSKELTEPFTILLMGVDSTLENISSGAFNGDSLMLVTFNPITLNATILSIPRDTFVPIMCFKNHIRNKITHAAWYGESCMIKTIENFTGIDIDYYMKINFKGVVNLVDALKGITVDVPITFCEQNSNREWGDKTIYIKKGIQTLNGEEALALSRHRKDLALCGDYYVNNNMNDFKRGQNQQLIVRAILDKIKTIRNVNQLYDILDIVQKNMDTSLTTNQILSFYNIGKDIISRSKMIDDGELISFQKLYLDGYGASIYDEGMRRVLYDYIYYKGSLKDVTDTMKINLDKKEPTLIKEFSFSINETYEQKEIGRGPYYGETHIALVPNFTSYTKEKATNWGDSHNIPITFETIESSKIEYIEGQIIEQSVPASSLLSNVNKTKGITLKIVKKIATTPQKTNCSNPENEDLPICLLPDFVGEKLSTINEWLGTISGNFIVTKTPINTDNPDLDNIIKEISAEPGTKVKNIGAELIIKYYKSESIEDGETNPDTPNNETTDEEAVNDVSSETNTTTDTNTLPDTNTVANTNETTTQ